MALPAWAAAVAPAAIGGLASFLSGGAQRDAANTARDANMAINRENNQLQKEFAQSGIQWKVADAKAAGIHPLAALGAQTHSFSPTAIGVQPDFSAADTINNMGQNIARGAEAALNANDKLYNDAMRAEQLKNAQLQNTLLESQITSINKPVSVPLPSPMGNAIDGQGNSNINIKPAEITSSRSGVPQQEAGAINDYGFVRTKNGYAIIPSKDAKERIEDQMIPELMWALRNQILPNFSGGPEAPDPKTYPLPKGKGADNWRWHPFYQEFRPAKGKHFVD